MISVGSFLAGRPGPQVFSGLDLRSLALTLLVGLAMGVMPLLWGTSLLCVVLARRLRLNHAALQAINYLCYPLQLALLLPFCRLGLWLFPWGPAVSPRFLAALLHGEVAGAVNFLFMITLKAVAAWLLVVIPVALPCYCLFRGAVTACSAGRSRLSGGNRAGPVVEWFRISGRRQSYGKVPHHHRP